MCCNLLVCTVGSSSPVSFAANHPEGPADNHIHSYQTSLGVSPFVTGGNFALPYPNVSAVRSCSRIAMRCMLMRGCVDVENRPAVHAGLR